MSIPPPSMAGSSRGGWARGRGEVNTRSGPRAEDDALLIFSSACSVVQAFVLSLGAENRRIYTDSLNAKAIRSASGRVIGGANQDGHPLVITGKAYVHGFDHVGSASG